MSKSIKVFLVEDSPVALTILVRVLTTSSEIEIVGTATNGVVALKQIPILKPDVICTDILMGKMDGLELTKQLMASFPRPILVISDVVTANNTDKIGQLLTAGAVDVLPKPKTGFIEDYEQLKNSLISKIKILAGVKVFTKINKSNLEYPKETISEFSLPQTNLEPSLTATTNYEIVAIGVSTGGPKAIQQIISNLPANFPLPIVITQHISIGFLDSLISWLASCTSLEIKVAQIGEKPVAGTIYFAPENYHLEIDRDEKFAYSAAEALNSHRPSVTVMLKSLAQYYGSSMIAILLTGMGKDGAFGMQSVYNFGGLTIAQDEKSSIIFGMPQEAIKLGVINRVLSLEKIAPFLLSEINYCS